jgi:hypothetical protein
MADQQDDAAEANGEASCLAERHPLAGNEDVRQGKHQQRDHRHGDAGEARAHLLLPPGKQRKWKGVGENTHPETMEPDAPAHRRGLRRQSLARDERDA